VEEEQRFRLLQRARINAIVKKVFLLVAVAGALYYATALVYATQTIYKVRKNYAVILEDLSGQRRVVKEIGWHSRLPFFTRIELEVPLMNQELYLGGVPEPQRVMSEGNVALWTSAMLTFRIIDLEQWGIENMSPLVLLQTDFDGIVKDVVQSHTVNDLISQRGEIKEEIFSLLQRQPINTGGPTLEQKYGIEVVSFVLRDTRFGDKLAEASEEKKRRELIAEAENYAADLEASRTRKLYAAYSDSIREFRTAVGLQEGEERFLFEFLNQQKWAAAYEKNQQGQNTFVLNNTAGAPPVVLPGPAVPARKEELTSHEQAAKNKVSGIRPALREAD